MIDRIIRFSISHRVLVLVITALLVVVGLRCLYLLPIDAVPDVTNRQVQINVKCNALGAEEMERRVTFPIELALGGLPKLQEVRSISQFGLSQVTVVFDDEVDIYQARQWVNERLLEARDQLPPGAIPQMAPISTGLGEIYYLRIDNPKLTLMEKRTLLDWVVRPQLLSLRGVAEVNSWGGTVRQFQVQVDPSRLQAQGLTFRDVVQAVAQGNANAGGGYVDKGSEQQTVRTVGTLTGLDDLRHTVIKAQGGVGVTLGQLGRVVEAPMPRQGAITRNGHGEEAYAITMLLMGENGRIVVNRIKDRVAQIESSLPAGSHLAGFLDRSELIGRTLHTAMRNLLEGGLLVVLLLLLFLGQVRAGLVVSAAIPLAMLVAVMGMYQFQVSANLMSLGAIDFGLIVDGSVIIVENCVRRLSQNPAGDRLETIAQATVEVRGATQFGELIIIASYLPILSLQGLEGKMFRPMGLTVILALVGAMAVSFTVTPALCALFLKPGPSQAGLSRGKAAYQGLLGRCLEHPRLVLAASLLTVAVGALGATRLGGDFIPELDEGAIALETVFLPGSNLGTISQRTTAVEKLLLEEFPDEIGEVVSRIGRAEIATDPMQIFQVDVLISLKPVEQWKKAHSQPELEHLLEDRLAEVPGVSFSFTQPIKMRMMELLEGVGVRSDLGIKIFGTDPEVLQAKAQQIAQVVRRIPGATGVSVETTTGLPQMDLIIDRGRAAQLGLRVDEINHIVEAALGGQAITQINDGSRRIDVVVSLLPELRSSAEQIAQLQIPTNEGLLVPLSAVCTIRERPGPAQISREGGQRRVVVQANVRDRDLAGFVEQVRAEVERQVKLPTGTFLQFGGTYEQMTSGRARLALIVPITFCLILGLLYVSFGSLRDALLVFLGVPLAASGGVLALLARSMTLSISACIGFIALAGVAVLNGVVMLHFMRDLRRQGMSLSQAAVHGAVERLRPVLMTAAVAGFGFLPMALSNGAGAEVQKPLATVVIGGLLSSCALTLVVLPAAWVRLSGFFEGDSHNLRLQK